MSKLNEIQKALVSVNDAIFQNLCDAYLFHTESYYPDIHRTGSQAGKSKTTKGTPDSLITLSNGKYILVEYTTKNKTDNKKAFFKKIQVDLYKCLNTSVTGIKKTDIEKVIYCCNSKLDAKETSTLIDHFKAEKVILEIKDIDTISLNLQNRCVHVAKEYLGIDIDTAQILTPLVFVQEYSKSGIAIPLTNQFFFREKESLEIKNSIVNNTVTILTGAPGIGKSRLALAVIEDLEKNNKKKYKAYCISNKNAPLFNDIRTYFNTTENYVILLDDANRQKDHLRSILPILNENRTGEIKVIITVRDYALNIVEEETSQYKTNIINIEKLSDEQITKILESDDIKVLNPKYKDRILIVADGNPRLAIMAAIVAKEKQSLASLSDASEIYDRYFKDSLSTEVFKNKFILKTLGVMSFFYSIDRTNVKLHDRILKVFNIDFIQFNESIDALERLELVETSLDNNVVRISEQVLSTYFFYTVFLKNKELDFSIILDNFFTTHPQRIKDTLIPANQAFGYKNIHNTILPYLNDLWPKVQKNHNNAILFLEIFWPYCPDELHSFIYDNVEAQVSPKAIEFTLDTKINNAPYYSKDKYLSLLNNYLNYPYPIAPFLSSLELSFEYVKKNSNAYSSLIKYLSDNFIFSYEDFEHKYYRQVELWNLIIDNASKKDPIYIAAFYDLVPKLIKNRFNVTSSSRKRNAISWYDHSLTPTKEIKKIRKSIWTYLDDNFKNTPIKSEDIILDYLTIHDKIKEIYNYDLLFLLRIIKNHFSNTNFTHCYIVQDLIERFELIGITHKQFDLLKKKFNNKTYKTHLIISYDRLKAKRGSDFIDHNEYTRIKNEELKTSFVFNTIIEFKDFYKDYLFLHNWKKEIQRNYGLSLDLILEANINRNKNFGLIILKEIINQGNKSYYVPYQPLRNYLIDTTNEEFNGFYKFISSKNFLGKTDWLMQVYRMLPEKLITRFYSDEILNLYKSIDHDLHYIQCFSYLSKYVGVDNRIFKKLLSVIINRNKENKFKFILEHDFFSTYLQFFLDDIDLLCKAYIQQFDLESSFDSDGEDLLALSELKKSFFLEFIKHVNNSNLLRSVSINPNLSVIWQLPDAVSLIDGAIDILSINPKQDLFEHSLGSYLFKTLNENQTKEAVKLLKNYLKKNHTQDVKVVIVFDIVRYSLKSHMPEILQYYLTINKNLDSFKKIKWLDSHFSSNGKITWSDFRVNELEFILIIVNDVKKESYKLSKHKSYLVELINKYKAQSDWEKKQQFIDRTW